MGTDIHEVFQAKKDGAWLDIESQYEGNRHYFLFAWLAGVRNGYGFAGVPTHTPVKPIAEPRGLPIDFLCDDEYHPSSKELMGRYAEDFEIGETPSIWMGDHSHSWLTADEILAAGVPGKTWRTGIVSRSFFDDWDGVTGPEEWSGGVSGPGVKVADFPSSVTAEHTHVRIFWKQSDVEVLAYFTDEIKRLKDLHGEVRMVFGFDS